MSQLIIPGQDEKTPTNGELEAFNLGMRIANSTYRNPADWMFEAFGSNKSDSGIPINQTTALTYSSVFAAVSIISSDVAGLPLNDVSLDEDGDEMINARSQNQWLLNDEPNDLMGSYALRETMMVHALLAGNARAGIDRDGAGRPIRLIPILPELCQTEIVNGIKVHHIRPDINTAWEKAETFLDRDILHIPGMGYDGIVGHSVITLARNSFGLGLATEKHGATHFKNNAQPSMVFQNKGRAFDEQTANAFLSAWENRHGGVENTGRPGLLQGDWEINMLPVKNSDAEWLGSRKFQRVEVANWFQIPPHFLGDDSKLSYNSIEAENRAYLNRGLRKWLNKWESECRRKLLPERVKRERSRKFKHDTSELIAADWEKRVAAMRSLVDGEIISRNEGRVRLGWNRSEDPIADELSSPNTRTDNGNQSQDEGEDDQVDERAVAAHKRLVADRMRILIKSEVTRVQRAAKTNRNFVQWVQEYYEETFSSQCRDALSPIIDVVNTFPGMQCQWTATELAGRYAQESVSSLVELAGAQLLDLSNYVTETTVDWPNRAEAVASWVFENDSADQ